MFGLNDLYTAAEYFIVIAGELLLLFVAITFIVGLLMEYVSRDTIRNTLSGKRKGLGYFIGAGFGALTPFCSCSTIPILVGLLDAGVPFGTCLSFLVASPLLNPVIVGLLLLVIGLKGTVLYAVLGFIGAVIIGFLLERMGLASDVKEVTITGMNGGEPLTIAPGTPFLARTVPRVKRAARFAVGLFIQVVPYLLLGAGIGAFIYGFVPTDFVTTVAGSGNPFAIPVAAIIGVPMYIRAETIIPISGALIAKGMGVGAVVALIIGGAGMSIPEMTLLAAIFKKRLLAVFIATIFLVAVVAGFVFQYIPL
ncbi:MAG: putative permease [Methanocella sp. PtaU1.Bin125]|nr:MAG: putative permease [Methanocella sp. PtaU1.Bin125]